uniref:Uncharacterized protein n=1 Tax=Panagrolaimus superbus TaxID=310955 RepID=A0A914YEU8_9BILA
MKQLFIIGLFYVAFAAGIEAERRLTISGRIFCCYKEISGGSLCSVIRHAKIELMNEFSLSPDQVLHTFEPHDTSTYVFTWSGKSFFKFKPYLNVHVECDGGVTSDKKYSFGDS